MSNDSIRTDTVVIGLGVMGAMTLWRLAARGTPAVGIEQFGIAHDRGSSHGGSRIFRKLVFEGTAYVPVVEQAEHLWRELERHSGRSLLDVTGGINIGTADGDLIRDALAVAEAGSLEVEILDAAQIRERHPQHAVFDDDAAVYEPSAGVLDPEAAVEEAVAAARAGGATVLTDRVVTAMHAEGDRVRVVAGDVTVIARRAVLASGPWFGDLLPPDLVPVRVQRSILHWFGSDRPEEYGPRRFPVFIRESHHLNGWGIPDVDGRGAKVGISGYPKSWLRRPEDNWSPVTSSDTDPVEAFVREAFPSLDPRARQAAPCMNAKTPDSDFIVGESGRLPGVILLGGFSGHGFKHASAIGEIAAGLAADGDQPVPIGAFSPDRFGESGWPGPAEPVHVPSHTEGSPS